mgnify:FL=1
MMSTWITNNFDIDLWIKLAAEHPYKFEQQRHQWLEHSILNADPAVKQRLRGLQWEMNMDLEIARNKFRNCRNISGRLVNHLRAFKDILSGNSAYINDEPAVILNFRQNTGERLDTTRT